VRYGTALVSWALRYTGQARKDAKNLASAGLEANAQYLLDVLARDPFQNRPSFEKLVGNLAGVYARRINIEHRLVYQVLEDEKSVKVLRMWTRHA
jgi:toxin YoeB